MSRLHEELRRSLERPASATSSSSSTVLNDDDRADSDHLLHDTQDRDPYTLVTNLPSISRPKQSCSSHRSTVFLDGLRGFAAVLVLIQHFMGGFDLNVHEHGFGEDGNWLFASFPVIRLLYSGGNAAVPLFFVLSGYVLSVGPLRMLKQGDNVTCGWSLVAAAVRRPVRLFVPALAVGLLVALLLHVPGPLVQPLPWNEPKDNLVLELQEWWHHSTRCVIPFPWSPPCSFMGYPYTIVVWTMPIEYKGSILIYGLLFLLACVGLVVPSRGLQVQPLWTLGTLAAISFVTLFSGHWAMADFHFGLILAITDSWTIDTTYLRKRCDQQLRAVLYHTCFVVGLVFASIPARAGHREFASNTAFLGRVYRLIPPAFVDENYYRWHQSWGALLIIYAVLRIRWLQNFFATRPMVYLGRVSFMLYLIHIPWLRIFGDRFRYALGGQFLGNAPTTWDDKLKMPDVGPIGLNTRFLVCLAVVLLTTVIVSEGFVRLIDSPSVRLGKMLTTKLGLDRRRATKDNSEQILPMFQISRRS